MIKFLRLNKKALTTCFLVTSISLSTMWSIGLYFLLQYQSMTMEEIAFTIFIFALIMPLFVISIIYIKWLMYNRSFKRNINFPALRQFFDTYNFSIEWYGLGKYWIISEPCMKGILNDTNIICRIDEGNISRLDFIIQDLDKTKTKGKHTIVRNLFNMEEPRIRTDAILISFNKRKSLTKDEIYNTLTTLISDYK